MSQMDLLDTSDALVLKEYTELTAADSTLSKEIALERIKLILQRSLAEATRLWTAEKREAASRTALSVKESIMLEVEDLQLLEPRGRFKVSVSPTFMCLENSSKKEDILITISPSQISSMALVPSSFPSSSSKKESDAILAIQLTAGVSNGKKDINALVFTLSRSSLLTLPSGSHAPQAEIIPSIMEQFWRHKIASPDKLLFLTARSQSFLHCHRGTQEGVLYPLRIGLLFLKPLLFLPSEDIAGIEVGRGGSATTRYVDLKV